MTGDGLPRNGECASPPREDDEIEAATLRRLQDAERGRLLLAGVGTPLEFWEAFCLAEPDSPPAVEPEGASQEAREILGNPVFRGAVARGVDRLRHRYAPLIRELRFLLERLPVTLDAGQSEMILGFIVASRADREAARRWLADPIRYGPQAAERIHTLVRRTETCRRALVRRRTALWHASVRKANGNGEAAVPARALRRAPAADRDESGAMPRLRRAAQAWMILRDPPYRIQLWEILLLLSAPGDAMRRRVDDLLWCHRRSDRKSFTESAARILRDTLTVRLEWSAFADRLRQWILTLPLPAYPEETVEKALALLVASPAGRQRAKRWLIGLGGSRDQALASVDRILKAAGRWSTPATSPAPEDETTELLDR